MTPEENDLLCRVEGDAPMGRIARAHWIPACLSEEVAEPDGAPVPVRLLGEDLVVFRDSEGRVGVLGRQCPHRRASLLLGAQRGQRAALPLPRLEDGRVRQRARDGVRDRRQHAVREGQAHGLPDAGMGRRGVGLHGRRASRCPRSSRRRGRRPRRPSVSIAKVIVPCNWAQILEGAIDSAHSSSLHSSDMVPARVDSAKATVDDVATARRPTRRRACRCSAPATASATRRCAGRSPTRRTTSTCADGVRRAVHRADPAEQPVQRRQHQRADRRHEHGVLLHRLGRRRDDAGHGDLAQVPAASSSASTSTASTGRCARSTTASGRTAHAMKAGNFTGIKGFPNQDIAMWVTMGPIADRTRDGSAPATSRSSSSAARCSTPRRRCATASRPSAPATTRIPHVCAFQAIVPKTPTGAPRSTPSGSWRSARASTSRQRLTTAWPSSQLSVAVGRLRPHARADRRRACRSTASTRSYMTFTPEEMFFRAFRARRVRHLRAVDVELARQAVARRERRTSACRCSCRARSATRRSTCARDRIQRARGPAGQAHRRARVPADRQRLGARDPAGRLRRRRRGRHLGAAAASTSPAGPRRSSSQLPPSIRVEAAPEGDTHLRDARPRRHRRLHRAAPAAVVPQPRRRLAVRRPDRGGEGLLPPHARLPDHARARRAQARWSSSTRGCPAALLKAFEAAKALALEAPGRHVGDQGDAALRRGAAQGRARAAGRRLLVVRRRAQPPRRRGVRAPSPRAGAVVARWWPSTRCSTRRRSKCRSSERRPLRVRARGRGARCCSRRASCSRASRDGASRSRPGSSSRWSSTRWPARLFLAVELVAPRRAVARRPAGLVAFALAGLCSTFLARWFFYACVERVRPGAREPVPGDEPARDGAPRVRVPRRAAVVDDGRRDGRRDRRPRDRRHVAARPRHAGPGVAPLRRRLARRRRVGRLRGGQRAARLGIAHWDEAIAGHADRRGRRARAAARDHRDVARGLAAASRRADRRGLAIYALIGVTTVSAQALTIAGDGATRRSRSSRSSRCRRRSSSSRSA